MQLRRVPAYLPVLAHLSSLPKVKVTWVNASSQHLRPGSYQGKVLHAPTEVPIFSLTIRWMVQTENELRRGSE